MRNRNGVKFLLAAALLAAIMAMAGVIPKITTGAALMILGGVSLSYSKGKLDRFASCKHVAKLEDVHNLVTVGIFVTIEFFIAISGLSGILWGLAGVLTN